ncbi:MAG: DUF3794 domain-containing protein [Clostridiales bacterium]|nr:DUF3794 domain-containing protein [Clostridiales bacterium]
MELLKKSIQVSQKKCASQVQITLDDDFNVPDVKPDMIQIIKEQAGIELKDVRALNGKVLVKGALKFRLLYQSDEEEMPVNTIGGELPIEEMFNMDCIGNEDTVQADWRIDDFSAELINSRKLSVRAIVTFHLSSEEKGEMLLPIGISDTGQGDMEQTLSSVELLRTPKEVTSLVLSKKDMLRLKEELRIPGNRPDIQELLFYEAQVHSFESKIQEEKVQLKGDVSVFVLYRGSNEAAPVCYESEFSFHETVDCPGCQEGMPIWVDYQMGNLECQVRPDEDEEERMIVCELPLNLRISCYENQKVDLLTDCYSVASDLVPEKTAQTMERLLMVSQNMVRLSGRITIPEGIPRMTQICRVTGTVRMDEEAVTKNGVHISGILEICILYQSKEKENTLYMAKGVLPFEQELEVDHAPDNMHYQIQACVDTVNGILLDGSEVEIKAVLRLNLITFEPQTMNLITGLKVSPYEKGALENMPSVIGYMVKPGDRLWDIAKRFHTTVEQIQKMNEMETEEAVPGSMLMLVKILPEI